MRQRKVKNLETKYSEYEDIIVYAPSELRGKWAERAGGRPVFVEIGCGKGKFISELAAREPQHFFVAVEGNRSVMLRALEKIREKGLDNVAFAPEFVDDLADWFAPREVRGIYLNFSDPLPKNYWYRRRLTYRDRLKSYFAVMDNDGTVTFKTDNTGLFEWSVIEVQAADLRILDITRDLHADPDADNIETEYEAKFSGLGEKIKRMVIGRRTPLCEAAEQESGENMISSMAAFNGRDIPENDKLFAATGRGKAAVLEKGHDAVINATVGALYDDNGDLVVLKSVEKTLRSLSAAEFVEYAPIAGTPGFRAAIRKAAFGGFTPKSFTGAVATPGGTGSIRNAVANYSCPGDRILTHDWHWAPYESISIELGRSVETFNMFDENGGLDIEDFGYKVSKLLRTQENLLIILNTPANNPTGYSLSMDDWYGIKAVLDKVDLAKRVTVVVDAAYIDFAGEEEETREFLKVLDNLRANVLPIIAYSASKTFTLYGFRCAAMLCLAHSPEVAAEFEKVCAFSARATWSNSPRAPQMVIEKIYSDPELLEETDRERAGYRRMLLARGKAFEAAAAKAGLKMLPYRAGFFVTIPYKDPDALCDALAARDVYLIPTAGGVRASVAAIPEKQCSKLPAIIKDVMKHLK